VAENLLFFDVAFTGHRPPRLGGWSDCPTHQLVKEWLTKIITQKHQEGAKTFCSGGALGTDQWAAEIVLNLKDAELHFAIPCDNYDSKWPDESKKHFSELTKRAKETIIVSPGPYESWKNFYRDAFMVEHSKGIIGVWDGIKKGGTWETLKKANQIGRPIVSFDPNSKTEAIGI